MYAGRIVESGPVTRIFDAPCHPYTQALLASLTRLDEPLDETGRRGAGATGRGENVPGEAPLPSIPGQPPDLRSIPAGCPFHPRCPEAMPRCAEQMPDETPLPDGGFARCWLLEPSE
jgi:oligopeptide/dipeptide ABC transporter ATP-binding protein